jgi:hypothetical protein
MTDDEAIAILVAGAPPFTDEQRRHMSAILGPQRVATEARLREEAAAAKAAEESSVRAA